MEAILSCSCRGKDGVDHIDGSFGGIMGGDSERILESWEQYAFHGIDIGEASDDYGDEDKWALRR